MISPTIRLIQKAQSLLKEVVIKTPILYSPYLSRAFEAQIFLKLENFQETGSFKERGAFVKLKSLSEDTLKRGVITMSAGNHAQ
ncbi:pyridoxal-phosphate dependent enzyme, partial [Vibrio parahaemolyticus]